MYYFMAIFTIALLFIGIKYGTDIFFIAFILFLIISFPITSAINGLTYLDTKLELVDSYKLIPIYDNYYIEQDIDIEGKKVYSFRYIDENGFIKKLERIPEDNIEFKKSDNVGVDIYKKKEIYRNRFTFSKDNPYIMESFKYVLKGVQIVD